jgi:hypothetical protein
VPDIEVVRLAGSHHLHLEEPRSVFEIIDAYWNRRRQTPRK